MQYDWNAKVWDVGAETHFEVLVSKKYPAFSSSLGLQDMDDTSWQW